MDMRKRKPRLGQLYLETKPTKDEVREYLGEERHKEHVLEIRRESFKGEIPRILTKED